MFRRALFLPVFLLLFVTLPSAVSAQIGSGGAIPGSIGAPPAVGGANTPIYNISKGRELQIPVNLWGFVGGPGHYNIPSSTTLIDLLSYAGGPSTQARLVDIRIIHADTALENRVQVFNLEDYRDKGDLTQNPYLSPGDTIIVSGRALDVFFQAVGIVTNIMVIITALVNFIAFTAK